MKRLVLVPNNMGSRSARALAETLTQKVGHRVFRVREQRVGRRIPFRLKPGTDKLTQLTKFKENNVDTVEFTTDRSVALDWLRDGCVFCRTLLRSSEGKGIVLAENAEELVQAPLYTKNFKKKREFRVHVMDGKVLDVQEKRKKKESNTDDRNTRIRNLANGYVFCRDNIVEPDGLRDLAVRATATLGYSIGAVDIAYNEHHRKLAVLEVNANPGLQGTTLENYANAIAGWYKEQR